MNSGKPYDVGYGRPPRATQFKPGHSGNPKRSRRKKSQRIGELLSRVLNEKIRIREGGAFRLITNAEAILFRLGISAASGNDRAAKLLLAFGRNGPGEVPKVDIVIATQQCVGSQ